MKKYILIYVVLFLSYSSNILGDPILNWTFEYYKNSESNEIVKINPSFNWDTENSIQNIKISKKFKLPNFKTKWECTVTLTQVVNTPLVSEIVELDCFYGGINKFPSIQTTLYCHYNMKYKSLTDSLFKKTIDSKNTHIQLSENHDYFNNLSMKCDKK